ncbi:MAG TPA: NUDIX domain-containing protein [Microlunatus sp.]|nr:NUDIX domain-containing protein [Microlunatus sp.]
MPTPTYILRLREHIGTDLLFLPGVSAVVLRGEAPGLELLLVERSDNGRWSLPAGIVEPGEQPAACILREVMEETCVEASIDRLALLRTDPPKTYPNGDVCQFLSLAFRCRYVAGEAAVGDDESTAVGWFTLDALPDLGERDRQRIAAALPERGETIIEF